MADAGVQVLGPDDLGDPTATAWTEAGEIDHRATTLGLRLAHDIDDEVERIARRDPRAAGRRLAEGHRRHRPRLAPASRRAAEERGLPVAATETKKGRCARVKDGARVDVPTVPWHWDKDVRIALAPGISCFEANQAYEHGGVSPQECVVPRLTVTAAATAGDRRRRDHQTSSGAGSRSSSSSPSFPTGRRSTCGATPATPSSSIAERASGHRRSRQGHRCSSRTRISKASGPSSWWSPRTGPLLLAARDDGGAEPMTELDELDQLAAEAFDGYLVQKDLAQQFRGQYPVPTYVGEFLLGRYCATTDPDEIADGLEMVQRSMQERTVRAGEEELFKHRAREKGRVKIIDLLRARLDAKSDAYKAELPSLQLNDIHISAELVNEHERMLTGGFYAEVTLEYIAALANEQGGQPFRVEAIRPIQMSTRDALGDVRRRPRAVHAGAVARAAAAQRRLRARPVHRAPAGHPARCGWSRSSCATTTPSSSGRGAPASRTCSSRSRRMPTSSPAARRRSPTCSST